MNYLFFIILIIIFIFIIHNWKNNFQTNNNDLSNQLESILIDKITNINVNRLKYNLYH